MLADRRGFVCMALRAAVYLLCSFDLMRRKSFFVEVCGVTADSKQAWAIAELRNKFSQLGRLPIKEDFDEADRARIKAFLGPWPRALEAAGLKEPKAAPPKKRKRSKSAR